MARSKPRGMPGEQPFLLRPDPPTKEKQAAFDKLLDRVSPNCPKGGSDAQAQSRQVRPVGR